MKRDFISIIKEKGLNQSVNDKTILSIDIGETTGYTFSRNSKILESDQITFYNKKDILFSQIEYLLMKHSISYAICESYRVYSHKLKTHANSDIVTLRMIGIIQYICFKMAIPLKFQSASEAKTIVTDSRLKECNLFLKGKRHARDSIRHTILFLLKNLKGN